MLDKSKNLSVNELARYISLSLDKLSKAKSRDEENGKKVEKFLTPYKSMLEIALGNNNSVLAFKEELSAFIKEMIDGFKDRFSKNFFNKYFESPFKKIPGLNSQDKEKVLVEHY